MTTSSKVFGFSAADLRTDTSFLTAVVLASQHVLLLNRALRSKSADKTLSRVRTGLEKLLGQHRAGVKSSSTRLAQVLRALEPLTKGTIGFRNGVLTYKLSGSFEVMSNLAKVVHEQNGRDRTVLKAEQSKALGSIVRNGQWGPVVGTYEGSDFVRLATQMESDYSSSEGTANLTDNYRKLGVKYVSTTTRNTHRVYITLALTPEVVHHRNVQTVLHRFRGNAAFQSAVMQVIEKATASSVKVDSVDALKETTRLSRQLFDEINQLAAQEEARVEAHNQKAAKEVAAATQLSEAITTLKGNPELMKKTLQAMGVLTK